MENYAVPADLCASLIPHPQIYSIAHEMIVRKNGKYLPGACICLILPFLLCEFPSTPPQPQSIIPVSPDHSL